MKLAVGLIAIFVTLIVSACREPSEQNVAALRGPECLSHLSGARAMTSDGKVRVALHELDLPYKAGDPPDVILAVDPARMDVRFLECSQKSITAEGALQARGVTVKVTGRQKTLANLPADIAPGNGQFWLTISKISSDGFAGLIDYPIKHGGWVFKENALGLAKYAELSEVDRDGRPTPYTHVLQARFVGCSIEGGRLLITCLEYEIRNSLACEMEIEAETNIALFVVLPSKRLADWKEYEAAAVKAYSEMKR